MSSSDQESISRRSFPGHAESQLTVSSSGGHHNNGPSCATSSSSSSVGKGVVGVPMVVNATSSSTAATTTTVLATSSSANNNNNNSSIKKHNLGYRLRRLLFPQLRSTTGTTLSKHKASKDVESNENQNFLKHSTSLYSNSSGDSEHPSSGQHSHHHHHHHNSSSHHHNHHHHRSSSSSSKRRRTNTRNQSQQTETLPEYPSLPNTVAGTSTISSPSTTTNTTTTAAMMSTTATSSGRYTPNAQGLIECAICLLEQAMSQYPELSTCNHRACLSCLRQYLRIEIFESRVNITCPECSEQLHPNDIKIILRHDLNLIEKYESFMVRRILITDPDARWCPAPGLGCASCPKLKCQRPGCETLFCYHCKQEWHSNQTCDQARAQRGTGRFGSQSKGGVTFSTRDGASQASGGDASFLQRDDIKPCPCCKVLIIKMDDGSCNHMTCSVCGTEFCWLCMQKISDLHYLSPSGCTFWGKKPWSRKKKIMWQLGMLVGAPVGIALIAGIAVPAIIIGIPVWVGRKLYARFERNHLSRHKSNLLVTTGVLTSIFVSPILAAVAVGIGVPILLAYVYGVVPISLCRSGGCGVTTSSSGVRIELDEDEEISANVAPDGVSVDTALSGHRGIANPSIGEVSLGLSTSLSIGSSSHLDRVIGLDIQPDRESSSIAACAGSITSSNLIHSHSAAAAAVAAANASSHGGRGGGHSVGKSQQQLETQADVISNKRFSFSSANADASSVTLSFGDHRSINTNISSAGESHADDGASLKVHTGSIKCGGDVSSGGSSSSQHQQSNPNCSLSPVEVHVNICAEGGGQAKEEKDKATQTIASSTGKQVPSRNAMLNNNNNNTVVDMATTSSGVPHHHHHHLHQQQCSGSSSVLGKYESRSLEYLASNYCRYCHKSHKPICPNLSVNASSAAAAAVVIAPLRVVAAAAAPPTELVLQKEASVEEVGAGEEDSSPAAGAVCDAADSLEQVVCTNSPPSQAELDKADSVYLDCDTSSSSEKLQQLQMQMLSQPSTSASTSFQSGSLLTKKAISQIFLPSTHFSTVSASAEPLSSAIIATTTTTVGDDGQQNSPKSGLSHSHSFTIESYRQQQQRRGQ
ncbi:E3 ubiquitin-protein ligase rnf19b [Tyrophagus putrescentiae]|nr:E3 ubiquitin-protein ligase rnf19b [Tyrophagus putrescentiae]